MALDKTALPPPAAIPASGRIASIDILRGFDMFWIAGGGAAIFAVLGIFFTPLPHWLSHQLTHRDWEGFSAWDLIMPLFLFIVGAAMPLAFAQRQQRGETTRATYLRILRRVLVLWILGMAVQGNLFDCDRWHLHFYSNTLQAIAAGYLIASIALLHLPVLGQVAVTILLLVGYWLLMLLVPFAGHPAGTLEPKANLALTIDQWFLRSFRDGTDYTWILSSMAFGATVLLGVFAGHLLRSRLSSTMKIVWLATLGGACLAVGWFWAGGFDGWKLLGDVTFVGAWRCPIIKHLFSSSMVLWAAGWSYLLLAVFSLLFDVLKLRRTGSFFEVIGANAIVAYVGWSLIDFHHIAGRFLGGMTRSLNAHNAPWPAIGNALGAIGALTIFWLILYFLYRKKTFLRV